MLGCDVGFLGTAPDPRRGAVASGRKKPRQHMADLILTAEKDRQNANPLFRGHCQRKIIVWGLGDRLTSRNE